jgi:hypothetical protein
VLFYVLTDDSAWAQKTLENISENIYFIGTQEESSSSSQSLSSTDQVGKLSLKPEKLFRLKMLMKYIVKEKVGRWPNYRNFS